MAPRDATRRVLHAVGAFLLGDLLLGCTIFSVAVLALFAAFGAGWLHLVAAYQAVGATFGTPAQSRAAWGLVLESPLFAVLVGYLGLRSLRIPWEWGRTALRGPAPSGVDRSDPRVGPRRVPMSEGALWAARTGRSTAVYRCLSLLLPGP